MIKLDSFIKKLSNEQKEILKRKINKKENYFYENEKDWEVLKL